MATCAQTCGTKTDIVELLANKNSSDSLQCRQCRRDLCNSEKSSMKTLCRMIQPVSPGHSEAVRPGVIWNCRSMRTHFYVHACLFSLSFSSRESLHIVWASRIVSFDVQLIRRANRAAPSPGPLIKVSIEKFNELCWWDASAVQFGHSGLQSSGAWHGVSQTYNACFVCSIF